MKINSNENYPSISEAWNAPIPRPGKTYTMIEQYAMVIGAAVGGTLGFTANTHENSRHIPCGTRAINSRCLRTPQYAFPLTLLGVLGGGAIGYIVTEAPRALAYKTARVLKTGLGIS
jgi:hypothetical protein